MGEAAWEGELVPRLQTAALPPQDPEALCLTRRLTLLFGDLSFLLLTWAGLELLAPGPRVEITALRFPGKEPPDVTSGVVGSQMVTL